jgi:hypothetical protein
MGTKVTDSEKRNSNGTHTKTHEVVHENGHGYKQEITKEDKGGWLPNWVTVENKVTKF